MGCSQRKRLCEGWVLAILLPKAVVEFYFVIKYIYKRSMLFVKLKLKLNNDLKLLLHSSSPTFAKPYVSCRSFLHNQTIAPKP